MEPFDRIGSVDQSADLRRVLKIATQVSPVFPPRTDDDRIYILELHCTKTSCLRDHHTFRHLKTATAGLTFQQVIQGKLSKMHSVLH